MNQNLNTFSVLLSFTRKNDTSEVSPVLEMQDNDVVCFTKD